MWSHQKAELIPVFLHDFHLLLNLPQTLGLHASTLEIDILSLQVHQTPSKLLILLQILSRKGAQVTPWWENG